MTEYEATVMYLNAVGILHHELYENWEPHVNALIVRKADNPKLGMDMIYTFEQNGRLLEIR